MDIHIDELEFAVFCIEELSLYTGIDSVKMYDLLTKQSNILYNYIIPCYIPLHTQGKEYTITDILTVMKKARLL